MTTKDLFSQTPVLKKNKLPENPDPSSKGRFPKWLHHDVFRGSELFKTNDILRKYKLNTVCEEAKCPNRLECYSKQTATFLALGSICTRACGFCDIDTSSNPPPPEADEPERIAKSSKDLGLKHVVITMVARDDLSDFGSGHIVEIIRALRREIEDVTVEVLTSDFSGSEDALLAVLQEKPEVFNHNIETVRRLTPRVRHKATYDRTLGVLKFAAKQGLSRFIKSGLMVGLGETEDEVQETICDLKDMGCSIVTIGQYLQPNRKKLVVKDFITPEQFKKYEEYGHSIGVDKMYCGPFVRSSYNASLFVRK